MADHSDLYIATPGPGDIDPSVQTVAWVLQWRVGPSAAMRLIARAPELAAALDRLLAASDAYRENALPKNQVDLAEASIAAKAVLRDAGVV